MGFYERYFHLDLPAAARRTFRFHLAYALLDATAGGVLLNAPIIALKLMGATNWQLPIREGLGGVGMLATLYLGSWMATRRKMPFVFVPGVCAGLSMLAMWAVVGNALWFLTFFGVGALFEITTRPAIAAILRMNYPVAQRGHVTGVVRGWSSLAFVATHFLAAYLLQRAGDPTDATARAEIFAVVRGEILVAAILGLIGFLCFRQIRVRDDEQPALDESRQLAVGKHLREALAVVFHDARYRRFLLGCLAEGFFLMLFLPLVYALLSKTLKFDYVWCAALTHGIPTMTAFLTTGLLGRLFDRANPWLSWAWVRFAFGVDALLLAITPWAAAWSLPLIFISLPLVFVLPVLGRVLRGGVQGGWWVLWWQIGITHFAPPGENTSRYLGIMVFLNGTTRILASLAGMGLAARHVAPATIIAIGGAGVILAGIYSLVQMARERRERRPETFAQFEAQFAASQDASGQ